jgi:hypothetical protein
MALVVLGLVALWTWALVSTPRAGATGIQVSQCTDDPSTPADECSSSGSGSSSTTVQTQSRPQPRPQVQVVQRPVSRPNPAETHDYSLRSGKGKVKTPGGKDKADTVDVSVSPTLNAPAKPDKAPVGTPPPPPPPPVSTVGGAAPTTTASPFSFVSADQALAQFEIPPFLVPIYIAAGRTYGIPWNVLASINRIETDFGRNLSISTAGAEGWMQFMPDTWKTYGVDATGDGVADPYNPVDAIYAAARYLRASGGATDLRKAIFSYNHAGWYVDEVLKNSPCNPQRP